MSADFTPEKEDYGVLSPFKMQVLTNFPYIEADFDALTNYGLLCKVVEYLNNVIANENEVTEQVNSLYNAYVALQNYVNTYFDNLDLEEEVSKKLDEMAEDGTLTNLIKEYIDPIYEAYEENINGQFDTFKGQINTTIEAQDSNIASFESSINAQMTTLNNKVTSATAGSPLVASSTAGMTDTSKVYVNTTDGKWYYYDGDSWEIGGTYQATGVESNSIVFNNLEESKVICNNYRKSNDLSNLSYFFMERSSSGWKRTCYFLAKKGTVFTFKSGFTSNYKFVIVKSNPNETNLITWLSNNVNNYTLTSDEYISIWFRPLDDNWSTETYDVDIDHELDNDDIELTYYFPTINKNILFKEDKDIYNMEWSPCNLEGHVMYVVRTNSLALPKIHTAYSDIICNIKSGYRYGIILWNDDGTFKSDSGWLTTEQKIDKGSKYTLAISKTDGSTLTDFCTGNRSFSDVLTLSYATDDTTPTSYSYNYNGNKLNLEQRHGFNIEDYMNITAISGQATQGFTIYDNYLVQLFGNGQTIQIYDVPNKTLLYTITCSESYQHGDTCQFSNTKYAESDLLPLLYVCADTTPGKVHVIRIQNSTTASVIKTYDFSSLDGYYCGYSFDFTNNVLYSRGYKIQSYRDATNNAMICTSYDMTKEIENSGSYTFELIERHEEPFIYCEQGEMYFNGFIYIISSYLSTEQPTRIYVVDPYKHTIENVITDLSNEIKNDEIEGVSFILNNNKYNMIIGSRSKYYELTFK